jgi:undecaprenyl-diphosphatase
MFQILHNPGSRGARIVSDGLRASIRVFLAGSVSPAVVGYLAIRLLLHFLANHTLRVFAYYRFALAAVVATVLLTSGS